MMIVVINLVAIMLVGYKIVLGITILMKILQLLILKYYYKLDILYPLSWIISYYPHNDSATLLFDEFDAEKIRITLLTRAKQLKVCREK